MNSGDLWRRNYGETYMDYETIEAALDYDLLTLLGRKKDKAGLLKQLTPVVRHYRFERTEETDWAFLRVPTFLDDGWTRGLSPCVQMRSEDLLNSVELGQIINPLVGGEKPDSVLDTPGGHAAALLFFCATLPPDEVKEWLDKTG